LRCMINHRSLLIQLSLSTKLYSEGFSFSTTLRKRPNSRVVYLGSSISGSIGRTVSHGRWFYLDAKTALSANQIRKYYQTFFVTA
jgi:hypothetical protein